MPQGCYSSTDIRVCRKHIFPPRTSVTFKLLVCRCKKDKDCVIMTQLEPTTFLENLLNFVLLRGPAFGHQSVKNSHKMSNLHPSNMKRNEIKFALKEQATRNRQSFHWLFPPSQIVNSQNVNCFNHPHVANANHSNTNCIQHLKHNSRAGEHCGLLRPSSVKDRQHSATGPASELPSHSAGRRGTAGDLLL